VYDAVSFVGVERGLFDDIVKSAGAADFLKIKLGVGFVGGYQPDRADTKNTIQKRAAHPDVNDAKHIKIVNLPVENTSAELNPFGCNFIAHHFEPNHFQKKYKHDKNDNSKCGGGTIAGEGNGLAVGELQAEKIIEKNFEWKDKQQVPKGDEKTASYDRADHSP